MSEIIENTVEKEIKQKNGNDAFSLKDLLETIVLVVVLYIVFNIFFQSSYIDGESMTNTYQDHDRLIVSKVTYMLGNPERGDIIAFHPPVEGRENDEFIKRVIGLPGEKVDVVNGIVTVTTTDGVKHQLDEDYIRETPNYIYHSGIIPDGYYVVFGDNRNDSHDSHAGWMITKDCIVGKAWLDYWPFSRLGASPNVEYDF